ncbi:hypothetical protein KAR91_24110, partial [Candidatus Pacearchaeota archaeon]|nr:hypothetical protein [Candidatus Pacearchaeota archaeon]
HIVDILNRRGYIKGERMMPTPLAFKINEILSEHCPKVTEVSFTREIEDSMNGIELGEEKREDVIIEAIEKLKPIIDNLREKGNDFGKELNEIIRQMKLNEISLSVPCPNCGSRLLVIRSKRTSKRFIGCSGMWKDKCEFSLPLPQIGTLTLMKKYCDECGFQMFQIKTKGRRPMTSCPMCFINKKHKGVVSQTEKIESRVLGAKMKS